MGPDRVAIIMSRNSGDALALLAADRQVWAIACREHAEVATSLRAAGAEISLFKRPQRSSEASLLVVLAGIDALGWRAVDVVGAKPTYLVIRGLQEYGVARIESSQDGFTAFRAEV